MYVKSINNKSVVVLVSTNEIITAEEKTYPEATVYYQN